MILLIPSFSKKTFHHSKISFHHQSLHLKLEEYWEYSYRFNQTLVLATTVVSTIEVKWHIYYAKRYICHSGGVYLRQLVLRWNSRLRQTPPSLYNGCFQEPKHSAWTWGVQVLRGPSTVSVKFCELTRSLGHITPFGFYLLSAAVQSG